MTAATPKRDINHILQDAWANRHPELDLSRLHLQYLPRQIFDMQWLRSLKLYDNNLRVLPDEIAGLAKLEQLDLWGNANLQLPDSIGELTELRRLVLGPNSPRIPSTLANCTQLQELAIGNNAINPLPTWLPSLHALEHLHLWRNRLDSLPDYWEHFPSLRTLNVAENRLTKLPPSMAKLSELQYLDLRLNGIRGIRPLAGLAKLQIVRLGGNKFEHLPEFITNWSDLEVLDLSCDESIVVDIDEDKAVLVWLPQTGRSKERERSRLKDLPTGLRQLTKLRALLLFGNTQLRLPDELLGVPTATNAFEEWHGDVHRILDYYYRTQRGAKSLNEAKLILLGWGGVGKTSLVNRLIHDRFDPSESRTEGIEISSWPVTLNSNEIARLNVWDFGGQEIMHATHQFFLTTRSIYLIVLSGRAGSADSDADYWLRIVNSFAPDSPIILALNQIVKDPFDLDERNMRQKFSNIRSFVKTDCAAGESGLGIGKLRQTILDATDELTDLRVLFPATWFGIKDRLAGMNEDYLTFERYRDICKYFGESNDLAQEQLANYLHSLGIALNFRDDFRLRDTHVLNPHWVTEGIYSMINSRIIAENNGELAASDLLSILDLSRYPLERHGFLLELMRKFELCFQYADDSDHFLIAELLPKQQPPAASRFQVEDALRFEYRYPVLPEGLVPRFIVRSHVHSMGQPRWRSGALLQWEDNEALVQADVQDRLVRIFVTGPQGGRRRLLAVIRSDFEHIHASYRFKVSSYVPLKDNPTRAVDYEKLLTAERLGMLSVQEYFDGEFVQVNVNSFLTGVDLASADRRSRMKLGMESQLGRAETVKAFISYSHRDERHRQALESHLKVLRSAGLLELWHDRRIEPGEEWQGEIDAAMEEADIVIFLVSADFLASDYCGDVEMARAIRRHEDGSCTIVPVIVRDSNWRSSRLSSYQALPADGKPITRWSNRDTAWRAVADGIEQIINSRNDPWR